MRACACACACSVWRCLSKGQDPNGRAPPHAGVEVDADTLIAHVRAACYGGGGAAYVFSSTYEASDARAAAVEDLLFNRSREAGGAATTEPQRPLPTLVICETVDAADLEANADMLIAPELRALRDSLMSRRPIETKAWEEEPDLAKAVVARAEAGFAAKKAACASNFAAAQVALVALARRFEACGGVVVRASAQDMLKGAQYPTLPLPDRAS